MPALRSERYCFREYCPYPSETSLAGRESRQRCCGSAETRGAGNPCRRKNSRCPSLPTNCSRCSAGSTAVRQCFLMSSLGRVVVRAHCGSMSKARSAPYMAYGIQEAPASKKQKRSCGNSSSTPPNVRAAHATCTPTQSPGMSYVQTAHALHPNHGVARRVVDTGATPTTLWNMMDKDGDIQLVQRLPEGVEVQAIKIVSHPVARDEDRPQAEFLNGSSAFLNRGFQVVEGNGDWANKAVGIAPLGIRHRVIIEFAERGADREGRDHGWRGKRRRDWRTGHPG